MFNFQTEQGARGRPFLSYYAQKQEIYSAARIFLLFAGKLRLFFPIFVRVPPFGRKYLCSFLLIMGRSPISEKKEIPMEKYAPICYNSEQTGKAVSPPKSGDARTEREQL